MSLKLKEKPEILSHCYITAICGVTLRRIVTYCQTGLSESTLPVDVLQNVNKSQRMDVKATARV